MSADDEPINQDDIEQLLNGGASAGSGDGGESAQQSPSPKASAGDQPLDQGDIEAMLAGNAKTEQPAPADTAPAPAPEPVQAPVQAPAAAPDDDKLLGQNDIEKLLNKAGTAGSSNAPVRQTAQPQPAAAPAQAAANEAIQQGDVEFLLNQAQEAIDSITTGPAEPNPQGVSQFKLDKFAGVPASTETATLDLVRDVDLDLKIELGRTHMYLEDVLKLNKGSVVPLDKMAGDPVDIYVNGRLIARGEVLVMNDNFCVRVAELIAGEAAG